MGVRLLCRNEKGNVAVLFGLAIIPIVLGVGVAIDYGRALTVRSHMGDAADAAALAIGSWPGLSEAELKVKAQQFFTANYPPSELGSAGAINVSLSGDDIFVSVSGSVPTTFMKLANINSVDVGATTKVTKRERNIELALVLDTTGSMDSGGKMSAMQNAAKKMVQDLFKGKSTSDSLKISVVPFAAAVNVGSDKKNESWIDKNAKSDVAWEDFKSGVKVFDLYDDLKNRKWEGCVRERDGSAYELTDATPSSGDSLFAPYLAPDEPDDDHDDGDYYGNNYIDDGDCGTSQSWKRKPNACQRFTGKYDNATVNSSSKGPDLNCPPRAITPLTNNQGQVISAIEELQPKGNTVIPAGLLWGWRVLSPNEPFTGGKPYDDEKWVKAIVLLTDGENYVGGGNGNHNGSSYSAFGYASEDHLGNKSGSNATSTLNSKLATVCSNVKAKGIQIYTIGFQLNSSTTQNLLKNCATKPDMYYNSPSNEQLATVFSDIAQGLGELRIAQ
ncbi:pilus assembly protein TadG-related protein [Methyloceanibacter sp.]|uniref:TadE/TadG family type IV pilus assembly protein n=1 Tax=Methyloceanibacter sp. TaxID=1965321 RepID=UPI003D6CA7D5